ncbi:uncharacterized protein LOC128210355 isoform X6 [Mya arenaria]|uniref:uncharacterized protein LOC128210355 isoform X6 n=1 Tax=Mya arenaria TaxID=6604 RepID=UPI0022E35EED|nr:uncharacterized protein LOC128210355 isoform X6 [Mya arenaria]
MHLIVKDYFPCDMTILLILRLFFVLPIIIDGQFNNPTTAAVIDPNCVDKISTCWHLPDEKCKAPYEDWARSNCAFRCGFCLGLPTTLPPCEDLLPDCANFDISVCSDSTYRPWASINCRLYCRHEFCSAAQIQAAQSRATTIAPEDCYDKVNCSLYATNVCDGNYTLWVRENCPQYCGICRGVPTRPPPCVDTIPNCKDYNASTCTNPLLNLWVKDKCRKHCGLCSSQPVSPPQPGKRNHALKNRLLLNSGFPSTTTEPPCEDTRDNCILYRHSACTNATYGPFMRKNCAKYCGFCVDATSSSHSTVPPTIEKRNQEGEDLAPDRRQFQASHHHEIMPNICLDNYDENCATMQPPASEFPGSEFKPHPKTDPDWDSNSAPPCEDKSDNCISYGRYACTAYYYVAFMQKYCAKYCEFCNDTNSVVECKDANPQCAEYDTGDLCTDPRYDAWNLENCMLYCKVYPCNASSITVATNSSTTNAVSSTETTATAQSTVLATTGDTQKPHGHSTAVVTTHGHGNSNTDHTNNARTNDNSTSTTSAPCEDKKDNCISYGRSACTNDAYVAFMRNNCAKFCGFCNDTNSGVECKDRNPLCGQYDTGDLCTDPQYDAWNLENCMLYCKVYPCNEGQDLARDRRQFHGSHHHQGSSNDCWDSNAQNCSAIPTLAPCEDKRDNCIYLGRSACTNDAYVAFMRKNCAKFCGFCNDTNSVVECKDANPQCAEYDSGDLCTDPQYDAWNLENCMLYCKVYPCNEATNSSSTNAVSSTETTVRAQPTVLATTGDTQKPHGRSTAVVTTHGHGNSNTGHTNNAHTNDNSTSTTSAPCEDKKDNCISYGRSACTDVAYAPFLRKNCAKFCGFCVDPNSVAECKDRNPLCSQYDTGDLCTDPQYETWNLENCMLYCKVYPCNGTITTPSTL